MYFQLEIVSSYTGSLEYNLGQEAMISVDMEKPYVTTVFWGFYKTSHRTKQEKQTTVSSEPI